MTGFLFNFSVGDDNGGELDPGLSGREANPASVAHPPPKRLEIRDLHKTLSSLVKPLLFSLPGTDMQLRYLTCDCVRPVLSHVDQSDEAVSEVRALLSRSSDSDLIPRVYEGGLVMWEGAFDLVSYLSETQFDFTGLDVLELGCGCGLPSIFSLAKGARSVTLQDYNAEVLNFITIPSVLLNAQEDRLSRCQFYSSSWDSLTTTLTQQFDLILTSETIYSAQSQQSLLRAIKTFLKPSGQVFLAAKSYYFGVGGSVRQFEELVETEGHMTVEQCRKIDSGVPRVILSLKTSAVML